MSRKRVVVLLMNCCHSSMFCKRLRAGKYIFQLTLVSKLSNYGTVYKLFEIYIYIVHSFLSFNFHLTLVAESIIGQSNLWSQVNGIRHGCTQYDCREKGLVLYAQP